MGYYSEVSLTLKKADALELIRKAKGDESDAQSLIAAADSIIDQDQYVTFYWNFVKWYDTFSSVQFITHFYHGVDEYSFKRIGEDYGDIEIDWNGDYSDIDELSEVRQSIEIAPVNSYTCVIFGRTLRGNNMRIYMDTETAQIITEQELRTEFYDLRAEQPETYDYSFECYVRNCCGKNGFLQEMSEDAVRYAVVSLILGGAGQRAREVVRAWKDVKYVITQ